MAITNCIRTGKYMRSASTDIDPVSTAFLAEIKELEIIHYFSNFMPSKPSSYKPLLYEAIQQQQLEPLVFVTGDSTSMIDESASFIQPSNLFVITIGSMNNSHTRHVKDFATRNLINVCDSTIEISTAIEEKDCISRQPAAQQIASAIHSRLIYLTSKQQLGSRSADRTQSTPCI